MSYDTGIVPVDPYFWVEFSALRQFDKNCFNLALGWDAKMFIYKFDIYEKRCER